MGDTLEIGNICDEGKEGPFHKEKTKTLLFLYRYSNSSIIIRPTESTDFLYNGKNDNLLGVKSLSILRIGQLSSCSFLSITSQ